MFAIYKRELRSYFVTPVGYVFLGLMVLFSSLAFCFTTILSDTHNLTAYTVIMLFVYMVTLPMLTMKLFAEERNLKTEQLLLTSPVSIGGMVMAKFFAAYSVFFVANLINSIAYSVLFYYSAPEGGIIFGCFLAFSFVGMVFLTVGMFISSLTDNQLAAAIGTFGVMFFMLLIGIISEIKTADAYGNEQFIIPFMPVRFVLSWFSIYSRFATFAKGIFSIPAIFYFVSFSFVFIFLTCRRYERRRYH